MPLFLAPLMSTVGYVALGSLAAALIFGGIQTYRVSEAKRVLAEEQKTVIRLQDNNATLTANETRLKNSITDQNGRIEALKVESETRSKAAMQELNRVRQTLTARNRTLVAQLATRMPTPGVDVCVAALAEARSPNS